MTAEKHNGAGEAGAQTLIEQQGQILEAEPDEGSGPAPAGGGFDAAAWEAECRAALGRAIGHYRMPGIDWAKAEHDAATLRLAEEDAIHALTELARFATEAAEEITNPCEPQDERRPFRHTSLGDDFEKATIAAARLAELRNRIRPPRY